MRGEESAVGESYGDKALFELEWDGWVEAERFVEDGEGVGDVGWLERGCCYGFVLGEGGGMLLAESVGDFGVPHQRVECPRE